MVASVRNSVQLALILAVLPVSGWEIGGVRMSSQEVLGWIDGVEQAGGEQRGPQGAAS